MDKKESKEKTILRVNNVSKIFRTNKKDSIAVSNVSFSIEEGENFGIIGESGSGKSTLGNMIGGIIKPTSGSIDFFGRKIQMIFQDPKTSFNPHITIRAGIEEGLRYDKEIRKKNLSKKLMNKAVDTALEQVQLPLSCANRKSRELSGGECQRAAIARAIIGKPDLLICDEITSALDVLVQEEIATLMKELHKEMNMTCLFISHDIALVGNISQRVMVMNRGKVVEEGLAQRVIDYPQEPYTKNLIGSILSI